MLRPKSVIRFILGGLVVLLANTLSLAQGSSVAPPRMSDTRFVPGEILVQFKPGVANVAAQRSLQAIGLRTLEVSAHNNWLRVQVTPGYEAETIEELLGRGDIAHATYNEYVYAQTAPNDPEYSLQWHLHQPNGIDINTEAAWSLFTPQAEVILAIIDTGVDIYHPDLRDNIIEGYNFLDPSTPPIDDSGHGTHVAGIAAAVGNNGVGGAGVAWQTKIMPLKALDASSRGTSANLSQAIYYAVDHGAKVINISSAIKNSAAPCISSAIIGDALAYANRHGVLTVIAAGNDGKNGVNCPAAFEEALAVGGTTKAGKLTSISNYGQGLDLVAPGEEIYSTLPDGRYGYKSGTSMAGPQVAGVIALVWAFDPFLSHQDMRQLLAATATDLGTPGVDDFFAAGQVNAYKALSMTTYLQLQSPQHSFFMADNLTQASMTSTLTIRNNTASTMTWKLTIPPNASWLSVSEAPTSGQLAGYAQQNLPIRIDRPSKHGSYTIDLTVEDTTLSYRKNGLQLQLTYSPQAQQIHLPLLLSH